MNSHFRGMVWTAVLICLFFRPLGLSGQNEIEGVYRFIADRPSNMSAAKSADILLNVARAGTMTITATKPGEVMTTRGTYKIQGDRMSLNFPELDKSVSNGPWSLKGDILDLPLQFIGDGPGSSKWKRVKTGDGPIACFFEAFQRGAASGRPTGVALQAAAEEAKRRSEERKKKDPAKTAISTYEIWEKSAACLFNFENGQQELAAVALTPICPPQARPQPRGPLTRDPRTHIPARPSTAPDDPPSKTAIIFAPFNGVPYFNAVVRPVAGKATPNLELGWSEGFEKYGEDLNALRSGLESCHYHVTVLKDTEATPIALYEAAMALKGKGGPGLIYFSTHGLAGLNKDIVLLSGVSIGLAEWEDNVHDNDIEYQKLVKQYVPPGYEEEVTHEFFMAKRKVIPVWHQKAMGVPICMMGMTQSFFRRMVEQDGLDLSRSFVYANACFSANNPDLARALRARAYLGNRYAKYLPSAVAEGQCLLSLLIRPTFSVREAAGLMKYVEHNRVTVFYPEEDGLAKVMDADLEQLVLYGDTQEECDLPDFGALYLCWIARWDAKAPEEACLSIQKVYNDFWAKGSFSRLRSPVANAGVRGTHVPTLEEVEFARHLVCGVPTRKGGRFTLNDTEPIRKK